MIRIALLMPPELAAEIDEWRRVQPDLPTRGEAIRRLAQWSLAHARATPPPHPSSVVRRPSS